MLDQRMCLVSKQIASLRQFNFLFRIAAEVKVNQTRSPEEVGPANLVGVSNV